MTDTSPVEVVDGAERTPLTAPIDLAVTLDDGRTVTAQVTTEGIILDAYTGDTHVGTVARMWDEWHDELARPAPVIRIVFTEDDVACIAEEMAVDKHGEAVDVDAAVDAAHEWSKALTDTHISELNDQLYNVVWGGQP